MEMKKIWVFNLSHKQKIQSKTDYYKEGQIKEKTK